MKSKSWYKKAKLADKDPNPNNKTFTACMYCKRWAVENSGDTKPTWKKEEKLNAEEKIEAQNALKSMQNLNPAMGVSHGICPICHALLEDVDGWPNNQEEIDEIIKKSLEVDV